jgi:hypothetical protein
MRRNDILSMGFLLIFVSFSVTKRSINTLHLQRVGRRLKNKKKIVGRQTSDVCRQDMRKKTRVKCVKLTFLVN